jgi:hypothetical protein
MVSLFRKKDFLVCGVRLVRGLWEVLGVCGF